MDSYLISALKLPFTSRAFACWKMWITLRIGSAFVLQWDRGKIRPGPNKMGSQPHDRRCIIKLIFLRRGQVELWVLQIVYALPSHTFSIPIEVW